MRRLITISILALCLLPGTCLRTAPKPWNESQRVAYVKLKVPRWRTGEVQVQGAWQLRSPNTAFGGFSALLAIDGRLLAVSDGGAAAWLPFPGAAKPHVRIFFLGGHRPRDKARVDIESLTRDAVTGSVWAGYEASNAIVALDRGLHMGRDAEPRAMHDWPSNAGPESLVRLRDGRFIVLAEGDMILAGQPSPGLVFASDPTADRAVADNPLRFRFAPPRGYRPVDMAQLPDGRVLILLRSVRPGNPVHFTGRLMVADPADIAPGRVWRGRTIALLDDPLPSDNYEGLTILPQADGSVQVWVISDDNHAAYQRTLLLKLRWVPDRK
ncbi:MAG: hypothetical protein RLZZ08_484 [Pseudomonadota bacterium]|jgi:hypothetical protein